MNIRPLALTLGTSLLFALAGCGKPSSNSPSASGKPAPGTSADSTAASGTSTTPVKVGSGPAELRLKWTPGQRQHQRMGMVMKTETTGGPLPKPITQDVTMNMEYAITVLGPREGGGHELELVMGDADMSVMMGEQEIMKFDSRGESLGGDNPATDMFRAMVGSKLKYLLNSSNRVEKVEGWQDVIKKVTATAPAASRGMLGGMFTEDYFKQLGEFGRGLPNRTVQPGETWHELLEVSFGPMGRMVLDLNYTFKNWEAHDKQNCAAVTFTGTVASKPGESASSPLGNMNVEGGKVTGTYWLNPETGRLTETAFQQNFSMLLDMPGAGQPAAPGGAPAGGKITTRVEQSMHVKFSPEP